MAKQKELMPAADLEPRADDVDTTPEQIGRLSLFAGLKSKPDFEKFPGTLRVRHYMPGDAICRQGEAGWTAFYILTGDDVQGVLQAESADIRKSTPLYRRSMPELVLRPAGADESVCATIYLSVPRPAAAKPRGLLGGLFGRGRPATPKARPRYIPIDAPTDIDGETLQAFLHEGELFGEMSCLNRSPRSATIIAARDCYVLEMLRNIFEKVKEDANYKKRVEEDYKRRALDQQMRNLPLFAGLSPEQLELVRSKMSLRSYKAGQIICDEHDRSDDVFIIRSGLVKVVKGDSALLTPADVADWPALLGALRAAAPDTPTGKLVAVGWAEPARPTSSQSVGLADSAHPTAKDAATLSDVDKQAIVHALNASIKGPALWTDKVFAVPAAAEAFKARLARLPAAAKDWPDHDVRRNNRRLIESILPGLKPLGRSTGGPETILAYRARGELIGEIGLLRRQPRSATCVAYIHARDEAARKEAAKRDLEAVELVQLPAEFFEELLKDAGFRQQVDAVLAERAASDVKALEHPLTPAGLVVNRSERFEELGLIQGQRLMLIDLDRCTRCDECVKACVATHDDGCSRLFLDGPRIGQYLVPAACRSCLDPVCMIGCPVGSIHRGDNGQIVIEDWCIGCEMCARQCPYGSIQMHDIGVIPEGARGWRWHPADGVTGDTWAAPKFRDTGWRPGQAPFALDRDFLAGEPAAAAYCFRCAFNLSAEQLTGGDEFKIEVTAPAAAEVAVWLNGRSLGLTESKRDTRTYLVPDAAKRLTAGRNVVAARVAPPAGHAGPFFDLRCDQVRKPKAGQLDAAEYIEKGVTEKAVVCDLCSSLPGRRPACVSACPHDAAMRVNARFEFPA